MSRLLITLSRCEGIMECARAAYCCYSNLLSNFARVYLESSNLTLMACETLFRNVVTTYTLLIYFYA